MVPSVDLTDCQNDKYKYVDDCIMVTMEITAKIKYPQVSSCINVTMKSMESILSMPCYMEYNFYVNVFRLVIELG